MAVPKSTPTAPIASAATADTRPISSLRTRTFWPTRSHHARTARLISRRHVIVRPPVTARCRPRIWEVSRTAMSVKYLPSALEGPLDLLLLTADPHPESVLPSLSLLAHNVRTAPTEVSSLLEAGSADVAIVDARTDLAAARGLCRLLGTTGTSVPVVAVVNEGGLVAVNVEWGLDEILLPSTGPAEIDARLRLLVGRRGGAANQENARQGQPRRAGDRRGHVHRPAARAAAGPDLQGIRAAEVSGAACRPGVHPRATACKRCGAMTSSAARARSTSTSDGCAPSSGTEYESLIGTVRNVGYKAVRPARGRRLQRGRTCPTTSTTRVATTRPIGLPEELADPLRSQ